jgi:hypothetical protein
MIRIAIILIVLFFPLISYTQFQDHHGSRLSVGLSYFELKDNLNYSHVFKGPDIRLEYGYFSINSKKYFNYHFSLGGGGKTAIGSWAGTWFLSPFNAHYSFCINATDNIRIYLGPAMQASYNFQNYPELHAGPILWLTSYDLGIHASGFFKVGENELSISIRNSLASLTSRTPLDRDPYFFSTNIIDNFSDLHSNMSTGSFGKFNQTEISFAWHFNRIEKLRSLRYQFNYVGYYSNPKFIQLFHQITYTWYLNKKKP